MKDKRICFIHTVNGLVDMFTALSRELVPGGKLCHIVDETLIQRVLEAGGLTPAIHRRVAEHAAAAEENGAAVIQLTCSSISPCTDTIQRLVSVPVLKVDEAMVETAVGKYRKVGIIATAPTTLKPSTDLVFQKAGARKDPIEVESVLCAGAFDAFLAGRVDEHDRIVRGHLLNLMGKVEVVLLAQASMKRIADALEEREKLVPVLSSPRSAVERLAKILAL
ncbi:MAG: Asp/Glu/hydantoin racemase [Candidatus Aminicenantes bacterium]|nr:Asp/Glu/hydantoin racemase [Candidatus Aminicenantes bacterium]